MDSRPTIVKSVVESADSGIELADSTTNAAANSLKIGLWKRAFKFTHVRRVGDGKKQGQNHSLCFQGVAPPTTFHWN